jgi:hypothetical protein
MRAVLAVSLRKVAVEWLCLFKSETGFCTSSTSQERWRLCTRQGGRLCAIQKRVLWPGVLLGMIQDGYVLIILVRNLSLTCWCFAHSQGRTDGGFAQARGGLRCQSEVQALC